MAAPAAGRARSALLWGVVGFLAFLVVLLAYEALVARLPVGIPAKVGVALGVAAVAGVGSYLAEHRLARKGRT